MFLKGLQIYLNSLWELLMCASQRRWLLGAIGRTVFFCFAFFGALLILFLVFVDFKPLVDWVLNLIGINPKSMVTTLVVMMFNLAAIALLVVASLFLMPGFVVGLILDEATLAQLLTQKKLQRVAWRARLSEFRSSLVTLGASIVSFVFMVIPVLSPMALLIMAWALGRESMHIGWRLCDQIDHPKNSPASKAYYMGLGLLPATLMLVPLIGWAALPTLIYAAFKSNLRQ